MSEIEIPTPFSHTLESWRQRQEVLQNFIGEYLIIGEDCGTIPGTNNRRVLFKPGAEKILNFMGLAVSLDITQRFEDWEKGLVAYEVKVTLVEKRTGVAVAHGIGHCNSNERKYKNQDAANVANTILKMAKKRALIDATVLASGAGGMLEGEGDRESREDYEQANGASTRGNAPRTQNNNQNRQNQNQQHPPQQSLPQSQPRENVQTSGNNAPPIGADQEKIIVDLSSKIWPIGAERALAEFAGCYFTTMNRVQAQELITKLRKEPLRR